MDTEKLIENEINEENVIEEKKARVLKKQDKRIKELSLALRRIHPNRLSYEQVVNKHKRRDKNKLARKARKITRNSK